VDKQDLVQDVNLSGKKNLATFLGSEEIALQVVWSLVWFFAFLAFASFVVAIFNHWYVFYKARKVAKWEAYFEDFLVNYATNYDDNSSKIDYEFYKIDAKFLRNRFPRWVLRRQIVRFSQQVWGEEAQRLHKLYRQLDFQTDSIRQIEYAKNWVTLVECCDEVTQMQVFEVADSVIRLMYHKNELIRIAAMRAIATLRPHNPLPYLDNYSRELSDWEQMKMIELLKNHPTHYLPNFAVWLSNKNESVVEFALRCIGVFQKKENISHIREAFRKNPNERIRRAAALSLVLLGASSATLLHGDYLAFEFNEEIF
jgi:hypothetical protein